MSHALATPPFATKKAAGDHQCLRYPKEALRPFHTLKGLPNSSSWFDQVPKFRYDVCHTTEITLIKYDQIFTFGSLSER